MFFYDVLVQGLRQQDRLHI